MGPRKAETVRPLKEWLMPSTETFEFFPVEGRRLGRRPADPKRPVLRMGPRLRLGAIPDHPPAVDYFGRIAEWCMGQNDRFGTCGPTSVANLALLVSTWLGDAPVRFTDDEIFDLYRRSGNPDFDPATGADDNGVDMTVMLSALVKGGIGFGERNVKALAFGTLDTSNTAEVMAGGALFGGLLWGADLSTAQQQQLEQHPPVWDYTRRAGEWGGHAILAAGRYTDRPGALADRVGLITWAEVVDATDAFITRQVPECYVVVWPWHLRDATFVAGVDLAGLASDYEVLTGRPFPHAVAPEPQPEPVPGPAPAADADAALVAAFDSWRAAKGI